jgi:hypothetical protein
MQFPKSECPWESLGSIPYTLPHFVRMCFTPKHNLLASWALALHILITNPMLKLQQQNFTMHFKDVISMLLQTMCKNI